MGYTIILKNKILSNEFIKSHTITKNHLAFRDLLCKHVTDYLHTFC